MYCLLIHNGLETVQFSIQFSAHFTFLYCLFKLSETKKLKYNGYAWDLPSSGMLHNV